MHPLAGRSKISAFFLLLFSELYMFDTAFERSISHEGGYQTDPKDRGNWTGGAPGSGYLKGTKYGISAMAYPDFDIKNITLDDAKAIYKKDFWDKLSLDSYPPALAYQIFDAAINHGMGNAVRILQRSLGVTDDGIVGPKTLAALSDEKGATALAVLFLSERLRFYTNIKTWGDYGKGWVRRVADNLTLAVNDASVA